MRRLVKRPPHGGRVLGLVGAGGHVAASIDHSRIRGSEPHITGSSEAASDEERGSMPRKHRSLATGSASGGESDAASTWESMARSWTRRESRAAT